MANKGSSQLNHRHSVGRLADKAADLGESPVMVDRMPLTLEKDEDGVQAAPIPDIMMDEHVESVGKFLKLSLFLCTS